MQAPYTGGADQKWKLERTGGEYYIIPEHTSGMALDISLYSGNSKIDAGIFTKSSADTQKFKITLQSNHTYSISPVSSASGQILTVDHSLLYDRVLIMVPQGVNNPDQSWYFEDASLPAVSEIDNNTVYQMRVVHSGKHLNLSNAQTTAGTVVEQYDVDFADSQKFYIREYQNSGYYTISPWKEPDVLFEVTDTLTVYNCRQIALGDGTVTDNKLFQFLYDPLTRGFEIVPKSCPDLCFDILYNDFANKAPLALAERGQYLNKRFVLEPLSDTITSSATYQDNGNHIASTTDSRGNTSSYTYDFTKGLQTGVTDAKGNTTGYAYYDNNDRLKSVTSGNSSVTYQYAGFGGLNQITAPSGTAYNFTYDAFWNT